MDVFLFYINVKRKVYLVGYVLSVFLALSYALGKEIFYLSVYRAKIILRPCGNGGIELWRKAEWDLLLLTVVHQ